jgi:hypothetical protein
LAETKVVTEGNASNAILQIDLTVRETFVSDNHVEAVEPPKTLAVPVDERFRDNERICPYLRFGWLKEAGSSDRAELRHLGQFTA